MTLAEPTDNARMDWLARQLVADEIIALCKLRGQYVRLMKLQGAIRKSQPNKDAKS